MPKQITQAGTSSERQRLAEAVAVQVENTKRLQSLAVAHAASIERVYVCRDNLDQATAMLERSKIDAADFAVATAMGRSVTAPMSIKEARSRLIEAQDELESAEATRAALQDQVNRGDLTFITQHLQEAVETVIRAEAVAHAQQVAAKVAQLQRDLVRYGTELVWLANHHVLPVVEEPGQRFGRALDSEAASALSRLTTPPASWNELHGDHELRGDAPWKAAVETLSSDPTATLPIK